MTKPLPRETATEKRDLPHAYEQAGRVCGVCGGGHDNPLHETWTERAAETPTIPKISWETGS